MIEESQSSQIQDMDTLFEVQVALAPEYKLEHPDTQLVVFVKDPKLGNMPILAQQVKQPIFPIQVKLTAQDAVMRDMPDWNSVESLEISARFVASNDIRIKEGALEDTVRIVGANHKEVIRLNLQPLNSVIVNNNPQ